MFRLALRRLPIAVALLLIVSALTFVLVALTPGDPATTILGSYATHAQVSELNKSLGFDLPVWEQYWNWLVAALHGDFGTSLLASQPVTEQLLPRLPVTLSLVIASTLLATIVGVLLGTASAIGGTARGRVLDVIAMLGFAVPNFWLALVLVGVFAVGARLLPATGYIPLTQSPTGWLTSLILPVLALSVSGITGIAKQTRDAMQEVMSRDFIDALRADGLPERSIILRHGLKNAAIPVVTMVGTFFIGLLGGTVLIENIFALPGIGALLVSSTNGHDLPTIVGIAVVFCLAVVIMNFLIDVLYGLLNPRARVS